MEFLNQRAPEFTFFLALFVAIVSLAKWGFPLLLNYLRKKRRAAKKQGAKGKPPLVVTWRGALASGLVGLVLGIVPVVWCFNWGPCTPIPPDEYREPRQPEHDRRDRSPREIDSRLPAPTGPSIAVLPFKNLTGDPKQEFFSDGFTETLIARLAQVTEILVIDSFSSSAYKGKPVNIKTVAQELGVHHILIGSVESISEKIRMSAQLVDGKTGETIWAEFFDREIKDIFQIKDEITQKIISESEVILTKGDAARWAYKQTENPNAYIAFLQGSKAYSDYNIESNAEARKFFIKAIELDPNYASAYSLLGASYAYDARWGRPGIEKAEESARKALELDDSNVQGFITLSFVHIDKKEHKDAIFFGKNATAEGPNFAEAFAYQAWVLNFSEKPGQAIPLMKKAIRLSPISPPWYGISLGWSNFLMGNKLEAIENAKQCLQLERHSHEKWANFLIIVSLAALGKDTEAKEVAAKFREANPEFRKYICDTTKLYKKGAGRERVLKLAEEAGLELQRGCPKEEEGFPG